jgi:hypothetical protein
MEAALAKQRNCPFRRLVQGGFLPGVGFPAREKVNAALVGPEDLGAPVHAQVQSTGAGGSCLELAVHIADVCPGDDCEIEAGLAHCLDELTKPGAVGLAVGNRSSVPVEDDRLEAPVELDGKRRPLLALLPQRGDAHWYLNASAG